MPMIHFLFFVVFAIGSIRIYTLVYVGYIYYLRRFSLSLSVCLYRFEIELLSLIDHIHFLPTFRIIRTPTGLRPAKSERLSLLPSWPSPDTFLSPLLPYHLRWMPSPATPNHQHLPMTTLGIEITLRPNGL
ncbi:hypothetical protein ARMGADRAFT_692254 [Armillaria gallica]|uniref:Uncharacterized protein n=1 Tax=Armillaria gallica TaxID=47427 RepID=A0A2H3E9J6_ARMGA|nr:hypothetical protein ARMGADRAFT_692254 [Armillaria gallica]